MDTILGMISLFRTKRQYRDALNRIAALMEKDPPADSRAGRELELLAHLSEHYEKAEFLLKSPTPIEAIEFCMEQQGLTRSDLIPMLGTKSRVSEVLSGKRKLNVRMIRSLNASLGIPASVLIG